MRLPPLRSSTSCSAPQHGAGMVPVSMAQHHGLDRPEIEAEPRDVLLEHAILGSGVEQDGMAATATPYGEQAGKPVRGTAQAAAAQHPGAAPPSAEGRPARSR